MIKRQNLFLWDDTVQHERARLSSQTLYRIPSDRVANQNTGYIPAGLNSNVIITFSTFPDGNYHILSFYCL